MKSRESTDIVKSGGKHQPQAHYGLQHGAVLTVNTGVALKPFQHERK